MTRQPTQLLNIAPLPLPQNHSTPFLFLTKSSKPLANQHALEIKFTTPNSEPLSLAACHIEAQNSSYLSDVCMYMTKVKGQIANFHLHSMLSTETLVYDKLSITILLYPYPNHRNPTKKRMSGQIKANLGCHPEWSSLARFDIIQFSHLYTQIIH